MDIEYIIIVLIELYFIRFVHKASHYYIIHYKVIYTIYGFKYKNFENEHKTH